MDLNCEKAATPKPMESLIVSMGSIVQMVILDRKATGQARTY